MQIGDKIRKVRELKGLKREYLAEKLGLSPTAYGNIERNATDLTFGRLEQIATILDVSVQDIISIPEQLNIQSITNTKVGFHYSDQKPEPAAIAAYRLALEHLQKEVEYLRGQNGQLIEHKKARAIRAFSATWVFINVLPAHVNNNLEIRI